jgi:MoxR-like ATPase
VTDEQQPHLRSAGDPEDARKALEAALFEVKRVIVGQDGMLERVFVALLAGGHLLLEGVPGLAKTLTIKTVAEVLGGSFKRIQFTPDLVPADLVGTRIYRPDNGGFDTEVGPVFCNFLLADEINRAPAKVQSALLEVMQEHQVTIGHDTFSVPEPFLVMATQNPIESEGTYPLPEAQVDRFMFKVVIDYPTESEEINVVDRSLRAEADIDRVLSPEELHGYQEAARRVYVDPDVARYAVALTLATREPSRVGLQRLAPYIEFGASPRASINLVHGARALALLRGRNYALPIDVQALAHDVLRHRMVLTYDALAEDITTDAILDQVVQVVPRPKSVVREAVA